MIDTILLVLTENEFEITNHRRFSPDTKHIYNPPFISARPGQPLIATNYPSKKDKRKHGYLPRLTLIKSLTPGGYKTFMKVEFSAPKILFRNNFHEITEKDLPELLQKLQKLLAYMGVNIAKADNLLTMNLSKIHYSKNIILRDYSTPSYYIRQLANANYNAIYDVSVKEYRNGGLMLSIHCNDFRILFYDKLHELGRARISEKRTIERDSYSQLNLYKQLKNSSPLEVLRMELQLNTRKRIRKELKARNSTKPTLENLFSEDLAKTLLTNELQKIGQNMAPSYSNSPLSEEISQIQIRGPTLTWSQICNQAVTQGLIAEVGSKATRNIMERTSLSQWQRSKKNLMNQRGDFDSSFHNIMEQLEEFSPTNINELTNKF